MIGHAISREIKKKKGQWWSVRVCGKDSEDIKTVMWRIYICVYVCICIVYRYIKNNRKKNFKAYAT